MSAYGVALFHTTSAALRSEKLAKQAGLRVKLIPVPRQLSSDCGISLRFGWQDEAVVRQLLADAGVDVVSYAKLDKR